MVKSASFRKSDVKIEDVKGAAPETISFTVKLIGKYVPTPKPKQSRGPKNADDSIDSFDELDDILDCEESQVETSPPMDTIETFDSEVSAI